MSEIYRNRLIIPSFWKQQPQLWFILLETKFALAGITDSRVKFFHVVVNLGEQVAMTVGDLILNPPSENPYDLIKKVLIRIYATCNTKTISSQNSSQFFNNMENISQYIGQFGSSTLPLDKNENSYLYCKYPSFKLSIRRRLENRLFLLYNLIYQINIENKKRIADDIKKVKNKLSSNARRWYSKLIFSNIDYFNRFFVATGMVCVYEEDSSALCIIKDMTSSSTRNQNDSKKYYSSSTTVEELFNDLANNYNYEPDSFELILECDEDKRVILNDHKEKTIQAVGVVCMKGFENIVMVKDKQNQPPRVLAATPGGGDGSAGEDDMLLGASASPTATTAADFPSASHQNLPRLPLNSTSLPAPSTTGDFNSFSNSLIKTGYVGLVNQAMTCYLNSLLQTLYMTPEFRNALYNWQCTESQEKKSIPFQLQKLFLLLQTSEKPAVETTELTQSFGWNAKEAWQQHDVQELCRVMFDALEQTFKKKEQSDLILKLYEGKMIDYVKCLECGTEKSREDTFLDIPLAIRPFGSAVAYASVEEALQAFVQPEILNDNNQYHCEKCNKKCDAHKGLKFSIFPYLLTLHLKRFDFDSSTFHRIKLNDKVVFHETLNLNSFVASNDVENENGLSNATSNLPSTGCDPVEVGIVDESIVKCDDSSTTDSGSALDDENSQGPETSVPTASIPSPETIADSQEDDEGIDVSNGASAAAGNSQMTENDINQQLLQGPYIYELFSIMIHSGSASGGHYYAYIKDFNKDEWYCFNDQSVTRITQEDIHKTYGGGSIRPYYGAYTSSTNAYMLMYRQIDKKRNCQAMTENEFPPHLKELLKNIQEREESEKRWREKEIHMPSITVLCRYPNKDKITEKKIRVNNNSTLKEVTDQAFQTFKLEDVTRDRCRLVYFDRNNDTIECSFENRTEDSIRDFIHSLGTKDLLLDIRSESETFKIYHPGGILIKVYIVNLEKEDLDGPYNIRSNYEEKIGDFKKLLLTELPNELNCNLSNLQVVIDKRLTNDANALNLESFTNNCKVFVACTDEVLNKPFEETFLYQLIERFEHIITLHITLPPTDKATLDKLKIPPLVTDIVTHENGGGGGDNPQQSANLTIPTINEGDDEITGATSGAQSDQSASEDSSLTDSDRTIVGDAPEECDGHVLSPSNSSPDEITSRTYHSLIKSSENWDDDITLPTNSFKNYYLKITPYKEVIGDEEIKKLKVLLDKHIVISKLQKDIEKYVGVSCEHFKLYNNNNPQKNLEHHYSFNNFKNEDRLILKLDRVPLIGEFEGKIFYLQPNNPEPSKFLFTKILSASMTVLEAKEEILEEYKTQFAKDIPLKKCRLRKKLWKDPGKVYLDDQKLDLFKNWEFFIQELPEEDSFTKESQVITFIRRWNPSKYTLGSYGEMILNDRSDDIKLQLSNISKIPAEHIEFAKLTNFPWPLSVINLHTDHTWISEPSTYEELSEKKEIICFLYRDKREELKELTSEEYNELKLKESGRSSVSSTYSPRREIGLKIQIN